VRLRGGDIDAFALKQAAVAQQYRAAIGMALDAVTRNRLEVGHLGQIERAVLRLAAYELRMRPDVPYRVVINEAIETVKRFGAEYGHTYVNGVLDHAAAAWRAAEVQAPRGR